MELRVVPKPELDGREQQQHPAMMRGVEGLGVELPAQGQRSPRQSQRRTGTGMGRRTMVYEMPGVPSPRVGFQDGEEEGIGVEPRERI